MAELVRVRTIFTGVAGTPWYSNLYFDIGSAPSEVVVQQVADFWTAFEDIGYTNINWVVEGSCAVIETASGQTVGARVTPDVTGGYQNVGDPMPFVLQGLIRLNTETFVNGRRLAGMIYVPGLVKAAALDGQMTTAVHDVLQNAAEELLSDQNGGWSVFSPTHFTWAAVEVVDTSLKFAVLRSRRD